MMNRQEIDSSRQDPKGFRKSPGFAIEAKLMSKKLIIVLVFIFVVFFNQSGI